MKKEFRVEAGVPQGLVIVPCLRNVMYNGLLIQKLPEDVKIIAFTDDVAVVATKNEWRRMDLHWQNTRQSLSSLLHAISRKA